MDSAKISRFSVPFAFRAGDKLLDPTLCDTTIGSQVEMEVAMVRYFRTLFILVFVAAIPSKASSQIIFAAEANFNGRQGIGLFQSSGGVVTPIRTGFVEHNFPSVSRDNRFITFSSPDGVIPALQVPPSSDIYIHDRLTGVTTRSVDHTTDFSNLTSIAVFTPVSAELSPDNRFLAYGVSIALRVGGTAGSTTRELNIADPSTGVILSNPSFGRGPTPDSVQGEFIGLSWDPAGNSFVTPFYVTITSQLGTPVQLPAITRFTRNPANGNWAAEEVLSRPQYLNGNLSVPPQAVTQIYPSISPSGNGLAYFELFWPDILFGTQAVVARLIVANADGSNPRELRTFDQGTYPAGLGWSPDGTQLVISIADQMDIGSGFLPSANAPSAVVRLVSTANGAMSQLPGINPGFLTTWRAGGLPGSLAGVGLVPSITDAGQTRMRATGVQPGLLYFLQSSESLESGSFGSPQSFLGQQLLDGIDINFGTPTRFFRLINP
jgi:hypothetical protein